MQGRNLASLEERCASLKSTIDQLNLTLERANTGEAEMRAEIQSLQRTLLDTSSTSQSSCEKLKQVNDINYSKHRFQLTDFLRLIQTLTLTLMCSRISFLLFELYFYLSLSLSIFHMPMSKLV